VKERITMAKPKYCEIMLRRLDKILKSLEDSLDLHSAKKAYKQCKFTSWEQVKKDLNLNDK